jgi:hypothetical protein
MTPRTTADLALAAYLHLHGLPVIRARCYPRGSITEYTFTFDDAQGRWAALLVAFTNSAEARYNEAMRTLKKLAKAQRNSA